MNLRCQTVRGILQEELSPLFDCREENGRLVIVTPFEYPDGDLIEFYVTEEHGQLVLTDLAETLATLASYRFDTESTPKRRKLFESVLKGFEAHYFRGEIRVPLASPKELISALVRLSQATLRTTDLLFTSRFGAGTTFKEEVEEYLTEKQLPYQKDYKLTGRSGQTYALDFYIEQRNPFLIEALSTGSSGYAEQLVNRTVRMWYDLRRVDGRFVYSTILDDAEDVWKEQQIEILSSLSELIVWSEREKLVGLITRSE